CALRTETQRQKSGGSRHNNQFPTDKAESPRNQTDALREKKSSVRPLQKTELQLLETESQCGNAGRLARLCVVQQNQVQTCRSISVDEKTARKRFPFIHNRYAYTLTPEFCRISVQGRMGYARRNTFRY